MNEPSNEFGKKERLGVGGIVDPKEQVEGLKLAPEATEPGASTSPGRDSAADKSVDLEALLTQAQAELDKYKDATLRATADLDNYRKRVAREREEAIKYANASFLERLIPILDNFELGLQAARGAAGSSPILDGMNMVYKQLQDFLASSGVETIDASGKVFDPNLHEAIAQEEHSEIPEDHVIRQLRKGYRLRDRLLRPANVVVSKGVPHPVAAGGKEE